jgi:alpha-L-rhamnosidase
LWHSGGPTLKLIGMKSNAAAPLRLRCEYFENPIGIDVTRPRLSWEVNDPRRGARQTAYRVVTDNGWDTGRVVSDQSVHIEYAGPPLRSRQRVSWKVRTWDARGKPSPWSQPAWWEMGLLERALWQAQWIGAPWTGGQMTAAPCPLLRKSFVLDKPPASARLYVTALGLYEARLNGRRVGDDVFTPGWTDYRKRIQYQTYDVTALLRRGDNALGAMLGDGWACGHVATQNRQIYTDRPRLLARLIVTFSDGSTQSVATDASWKVAPGPILEADLLMGESYDARRERPGWDAPVHDDARWLPVEVFADTPAALVASASPRVRRIRSLRPIAPPARAGKKWIFDLGQNMVGVVRLKVRGQPGKTVTLRHAEVLNPDGSIYTANLRRAKATDHYTLGGAGVEVYEPRFTFHGFRYVELTWPFDEPPARDTVTGIVLHSDIQPSGAFECSDPLINQLQRNIQWSQRGNFLEVPTDCPQRDERLGWTGDAQIFCPTACFNMDVAGFFTKWQTDLADTQRSDGDIPSIAPVMAPEPRPGGPAWSDALIICPWTIYQCYGDTRLLQQHYERFARFVECLRGGSQHLIRAHHGAAWQGYGDWLAQDGSGNVFGGTPKDLIGTAFFAHSARLLSRIAGLLGKKSDAAKYARYFEQIRRAFQKRFVTAAGLVGNQTQTCYVLALHFDLLPAKLRRPAVRELVRDIQRRGNKLSTGFVGSPYLPVALSDNGHLDVAYRLLFQKDWPSWLYAVTQGATTIWERWDGWTHDKGFQDPGMNSFNHYAYGAIGHWLYSRVAGLELDPERPGYKHIVIRPHPGPGITWARARLHSMHGVIESGWRLSGKTFRLEISVPPNTTATAHFPATHAHNLTESGKPPGRSAGVRQVRKTRDGVRIELGAGRYRFAGSSRAG